MSNANAHIENNIHRTHATHCCTMHGCKYGQPWCPVKSGEVRQEFTCEFCDDEFEYVWNLAHMMNEMYDKGYSDASENINHLHKCGCDNVGSPGCLGS